MVQIIGSYMQNTERVQFCKPTTMEVVVSEFGFHDFSIRHRPIQPTSFNSFVLHYVKKGKGIFKIEKKVYEISGGTFFMSPPGIQVTLIPDAEDPWCYYWMNCFGQEIPKLFNDAKLSVNNPLYVYPDKEEIEREFKTLFENTKNSWAPHHLFALASFLNIMGKITLSRSDSQEPQNLASSKSHYAQKIIKEIEDNYKNPEFNIQTICDRLFIHHSYACRIFKEETGCSIKQYVVRRRMIEAEILLKYTSNNIMQIAGSCGYKEAFNFTKAFHKYFQISPSEYRKKYSSLR